MFLTLTLAVFISAQAYDAKPHRHINVMPNVQPRATSQDATECSMCVSFMDQFLNALLNEILNGGVIGSCSGLCAAVSVGNPIAFSVCELLCDYVGINAFIRLIQWADLDPVWLCEEITFCKKTTCTSNCAAVHSVTAEPLTLPSGNYINFTVIASVLSENVGVSSIGLVVTNTQPDSHGNYFQDMEVGILYQPGVETYRILFPILTSDSDGMGDTYPWPTGTYNSTAMFCEGLCGSNHTGSGEILASMNGPNFQLTGN